MSCRCHADAVYAGLVQCPGCGHRSFDPICRACERRRCGYVAGETNIDELQATAREAEEVEEDLPDEDGG